MFKDEIGCVYSPAQLCVCDVKELALRRKVEEIGEDMAGRVQVWHDVDSELGNG